MGGGDSGRKIMVSVLLHLSLKFLYGETVDDGGENGRSDGFGGNEQQGIIGVTDEVINWEHIQDKENGAALKGLGMRLWWCGICGGLMDGWM